MSQQIKNIQVSSIKYFDGILKINVDNDITLQSLYLSKQAYEAYIEVAFTQQDDKTILINLNENANAFSVLRGRYVLKASDNYNVYEFNYDSYNSNYPWLRPKKLGKFSWNPFTIYLMAQSNLLQFVFDVDVNVESDSIDFPYTGEINQIYDDDKHIYVNATFRITRPQAISNFKIATGLFLVRSSEQKTIDSEYEEIKIDDENVIYNVSAVFLKEKLGSFGQWNFGIQLTSGDDKFHLKIRRTSKKIYSKIFSIASKNWFDSSIDGVVIDPQFMSNGNFMLRARPKTKLETSDVLQNMKLAYEIYNIQNGLRLPVKRNSKGVRLVFERETWFAQDNAFAVFKKAKLNGLDEGEMKYIIDPESPFVSNVLKVTSETDILYKYSVEYFYALLTAKEIITSIFPLELYSLYKTSSFFVNQIRSIPVYYLGHGLLALKRMTADYSFGSGLFDRVSVGSTFDYKVHREKLGFGRDNIRKLGYPRWSDLLSSQSLQSDNPKKILYFPTWRPWVDKLTDDEFKKSDYFLNIQKLINDKDILSVLKENKCEMIVYLHPNIRRFSKVLAPNDSNYIHVINNESVSVEELEMQCDVIISDYSSVVWDFAIQNKPVIYYQFDQEKYLTTQGSYIALKNPIYGDVTTNVEELAAALEENLKGQKSNDISGILYNSYNSEINVLKDIMSENLPNKKHIKDMSYDWLIKTWTRKERI